MNRGEQVIAFWGRGRGRRGGRERRVETGVDEGGSLRRRAY